MHFQDEMVYLFFNQNETLKSAACVCLCIAVLTIVIKKVFSFLCNLNLVYYHGMLYYYYVYYTQNYIKHKSLFLKTCSNCEY